MERLRLLSHDKMTLGELRDFMRSHLEKKLISRAMKKEDVSGFAEAFEIIKSALDEIDNYTKVDKKINLNQSE